MRRGRERADGPKSRVEGDCERRAQTAGIKKSNRDHGWCPESSKIGGAGIHRPIIVRVFLSI